MRDKLVNLKNKGGSGRVKIKRVLTSVVSGFITVSLLVGCSATPTGGDKLQGNISGSELSGEIRVAAWNNAADALEAAIPGFNEKYPNVKVTVQRSTADKIIPALTAGIGAPDVFQTQQRDFQNYIAKFPGQMVDLSEQLQSHEDEFAKTAWTSVVKDGKAYAVPWDLGPVAVYYRKDYFKQAGIDPTTLTTWDKFIEAGKELQRKKGNKVKMTTLDHTGTGDMDFWLMLMNQAGGSFINDRGELDFTQEKNIEAMKTVKRIKDDISINTSTWDDRLRAVVNGEVATIVYPVWYSGSMKHQAADLKGKWGVMPLPAFTEGGSNQANLGSSVLAISEQSRNKEAAWAFIRYCLLTTEGQDTQWKYGLFPAWTPSYQTETFKQKDPYFGMELSEFFAEKSIDIPELKFPPEFTDFNKPLMDANAAVLNQDMEVEKAFAQAEQKAAKATGLKVAR